MSHYGSFQNVPCCASQTEVSCMSHKQGANVHKNFRVQKYRFNSIFLCTLELEAAIMVVVNLGGVSVMTCRFRVQDIRFASCYPLSLLIM